MNNKEMLDKGLSAAGYTLKSTFLVTHAQSVSQNLMRDMGSVKSMLADIGSKGDAFAFASAVENGLEESAKAGGIALSDMDRRIAEIAARLAMEDVKREVVRKKSDSALRNKSGEIDEGLVVSFASNRMTLRLLTLAEAVSDREALNAIESAALLRAAQASHPGDGSDEAIRSAGATIRANYNKIMASMTETIARLEFIRKIFSITFFATFASVATFALSGYPQALVSIPFLSLMYAYALRNAAHVDAIRTGVIKTGGEYLKANGIMKPLSLA